MDNEEFESVEGEINHHLFLIEDNLNAWRESVESNIAFIMENMDNLKACLLRQRQPPDNIVTLKPK